MRVRLGPALSSLGMRKTHDPAGGAGSCVCWVIGIQPARALTAGGADVTPRRPRLSVAGGYGAQARPNGLSPVVTSPARTGIGSLPRMR